MHSAFKDSFTPQRNIGKRHNEATAVTSKLQRSNVAQSIDMLHWTMNVY